LPVWGFRLHFAAIIAQQQREVGFSSTMMLFFQGAPEVTTGVFSLSQSLSFTSKVRLPGYFRDSGPGEKPTRV
jgi:hypothetical protein